MIANVSGSFSGSVPVSVIGARVSSSVVIDWGLALPVARQGVFKDVAEQTIAPRSGKHSRTTIGCIGTLAFMSPEQARGDVPLTPASYVELVLVWQEDLDPPQAKRFRELIIDWKNGGKLWG